MARSSAITCVLGLLYLDAQYLGLASRRIVGNQVRRRVRLADQYRSNTFSFRLMCSPTCCPIRGQKRKLSPRETMSVSLSIVLQKSFRLTDHTFSACRRGDRMLMWGTTSFCDELTGDFGGAFQATSIDDCSLFYRLAEN